MEDFLKENFISRKLWPAHLKPEDDELFSSWFARLSLAHGLSPYSFGGIVWPQIRLWSLDLDRINVQAILQTLEERTGTPISRIISATLGPLEGRLYEDSYPRNLRVNWIMPLGNFYTLNRRKQGLQFCPKCLSMGIPYFRLRWRIGFVVVCPVHRIQLQDRCPQCGSGINFYRIKLHKSDIDNPEHLAICHGCEFDLRDSLAYENQYPVGATEIAYQEFLMSVIRDGWVEVPGNGLVNALSYFEGMHQLMSVLIYRTDRQGLIDTVVRHYGLNLQIPEFPKKDASIEVLNVAQRRTLVMLVQELFRDWPEGFIEFCRAHGVWSYTLFRHRRSIPFWFWRVVNENLNRTIYSVSDQEFASIVNYILKTGGVPDKHELSKYLSRGIYQKMMRKAGLIKWGINVSKCPRCGATERQIKGRRTRAGDQCYACRLCGRYYTPKPMPRGYPESFRLKAVEMYLKCGSYSLVAQELAVRVDSVIKWHKKYGNEF